MELGRARRVHGIGFVVASLIALHRIFECDTMDRFCGTTPRPRLRYEDLQIIGVSDLARGVARDPTRHESASITRDIAGYLQGAEAAPVPAVGWN
jgi:hypothetical protein